MATQLYTLTQIVDNWLQQPGNIELVISINAIKNTSRQRTKWGNLACSLLSDRKEGTNLKNKCNELLEHYRKMNNREKL